MPKKTNRNCYAHAFKLGIRPSWYHTQPGSISGVYKKGAKKDYRCPTLINRVLKDNPDTFYQPNCEPCPKKYYKVALAIDPKNSDYHFYRKNGEPNLWSHKPGRNKVRYISSNPYHMKRKNGKYTYSDWCGCFCTQ